MIWNDSLNREIPSSWIISDLMKLVKWESNSQPPKSQFKFEPSTGYIRFIQNRDYDSNDYITYIPISRNLSIVNEFDILIDKYGDAGAVRYGISGAFNVALGKLTPHEMIFQEYIRSYLEDTSIYKYLHGSCMASTRASLSEENLKHLKIMVPNKSVLLKYQGLVHKVRKQILTIKKQSEELSLMKNKLLPLLINQQLL